jgi:hypothetical protein
MNIIGCGIVVPGIIEKTRRSKIEAEAVDRC